MTLYHFIKSRKITENKDYYELLVEVHEMIEAKEYMSQTAQLHLAQLNTCTIKNRNTESVVTCPWMLRVIVSSSFHFI